MTLNDEIENLVFEIERKTSDTRQAARQRSEAQHSFAIRNNLGTIVLSGYGQLVSIDLNRSAVRTSTEAVLSAAVVDTISRGEELVSAHYREGKPLEEESYPANQRSEPVDEESWEEYDWI